MTLQIVPRSPGPHHIPSGPFILLGFEDPADPEFLHVEYATGALQSEDPTQIQACVEIARLPQATAVRDSKNPAAGILTFPVTLWSSFLSTLV